MVFGQLEEYVQSNPLVFKKHISGMVGLHHWLLEDNINFKLLVFQTHFIKGWYIIGVGKITFISIL